MEIGFGTRLGKLSFEEVEYWKSMFNKTLKLGVEYEIEVPQELRIEGRRSCDGNGRNQCPCTRENDCEEHNGTCYDYARSSCRGQREHWVGSCRTRVEGRCTSQLPRCSGCSHYEFHCVGDHTCSRYRSVCATNGCDDFTSNCGSCPANRGGDDSAIDILSNMLVPTKSVDKVGKYGIFDVKADHSIAHGVEVVTVGRRYHWDSFYDMNSRILDKLVEMNCFTSNHCSVHYHILNGYNGRGDYQEAEKDVPEIILANFYQLVRIFTPELFWLTSTGEQDYALTRYTLFRQPIFDWSPIDKPMQVIQREIREKVDRYSMFNLGRAVIDGRNIRRFHVELRFPDSNLSPACVTAYGSLIIALVMKAIELSRCGVISVPNGYIKDSKKLFSKFANLGTGDRESDTSEFTQEDIEKMQIRTREMIQFLKGQLISLDNFSYDILSKLAVTPPSFLRTFKKLNWTEIEKTVLSPKSFDKERVEAITSLIECQFVKGYKNMDEWVEGVAKQIGTSRDRVKYSILQLKERKILIWDDELGQPLFKG